ncbi:acylphosphatase [Pseudorhodoplanes sinuspersici]|uniref:acylphosphatase n=1 Tax=Pseudorhodoplanes sinuspersici TaxID=1235591 RepID=A0A1W6ZWB5_9HYPH|nr:acylphosphatase [Pseudorhodoplanes sinuspersici]ARQ01421.1 acylphosphatase [Pseudorhodoplanes sinuspersici]RKE73109.1 acylphosphatase [Pseudorhodoplanes sinuspersici]
MSERVIRQVVIRGRVQGVGYRDWTRHVARDRGIEGWVRNRQDGSVEAVFAGTPQAVSGMIAACRKGPSNSAVQAIQERDGTAEEFELRGDRAFAVLPTA